MTARPTRAPARFVVLLTGHPGVGKSTFARPLARALDAVCLSKDEIRYRVFDGWEPEHPELRGVSQLRVGESQLSEDKVVWSIFFWAVSEAAAVGPVVAETAMTTPATRIITEEFVAALDVPVIEVVLEAPTETVVERWRARALSADAHPVRRKHKLGTEHRLLSTEYRPLLSDDLVLRIDASDLSRLHPEEVASAAEERLQSLSGTRRHGAGEISRDET